ncbi:YraN family protein [Shewanella sp. SNU WT4]|uniref:YraN family protein n=1 Tax=Shewanella sp. SNU WT4 TaxID=2590015 RepID=UPI0011292F54|nr:YraN family protein [Shewanella sp. SNU WT4]QDF65816.1 YraN family protein [Shewanella sp. SNU WT4]
MTISGAEAEQLACQYLQAQGLVFVASNVRYPFGELDLVMRDNDYWVFVEVKYRSHQGYGGALAAMSPQKIQRLRRAASHYLQLKHIDAPCRCDVLAIDNQDYQWLKDAF